MRLPHLVFSADHYADGQFLASITYTFREKFNELVTASGNWRTTSAYMSYPTDSTSRAGTSSPTSGAPEPGGNKQQRPHATNSAVARAQARMDGLLDKPPQRKYCGIAIRPFQLVFDGVLFSLLLEQGHSGQEDEYDWAERSDSAGPGTVCTPPESEGTIGL
ncbi:hypothetical protein [Spongiactinospora sp. 9N601]|uniref:hypothetical protein n=1 Tax=Spongiactinospora sp. 9N601 TaxID=3375149 RepID=UPI0037AA2345